MPHGNEMICQPVTLSGYVEWPKVADAVIEAFLSFYTWGVARAALHQDEIGGRRTTDTASGGRDQLALPTQARQRLECERQILACVSSGQHDA